MDKILIVSDKLDEVLSSIEVWKPSPFVNQHDVDKITSELCNTCIFIASSGMTFRNRYQGSKKINRGLIKLAARQEKRLNSKGKHMKLFVI